jgi:ABC-type branched-subunit amino acid transport system ATPase component
LDDLANSPFLKVQGVDAGYGRVPVIRSISVAVASGEVVAVIGPNGAGKSTLMKAITGVLRTSAGSVTAGDTLLTGLRSDRIARLGVGYVPQVRDVFDTLTVRENLEMGGYTLPKREVNERIEQVMVVFPRLASMANRRAINASGGERKMIAMGRVMMTHPSVLLLDEPTANLAPKIAHELLNTHVRSLADTGIAVLLVEQRAREALTISDRAYVMVSGEVRVTGPAKELLARSDLGDLFLGRSSARVDERSRQASSAT